ncbi:MAG: NADH-quinone oxidoreductase subunit NuoH [Verrucomicrobia bacterium]|nr:NADH-quinone oxidoreductase subunit NuoH [Verrucomicrobiota bacterium]MCF7708364.1 NADH-quinone oxidoreductase subunit NuoH [Verrucomicrobiota bacterium]
MESYIYRTDKLILDLTEWLTEATGSAFAAEVVKMSIAAAVLSAFVGLLAMILIYIERKVAGHMQQRVGPMRVGPHGILQTVADSIKLVAKEGLTPKNADAFIFNLAPLLVFASSFACLSFIPFSPGMTIVSFNVGLLFILGIASVGVLGILAGGWASNNKWSVLGAMRSGAQIISYELSATLALLAIVPFFGTLDFQEIVLSQQKGWWIWRAPGVGLLGFLIYTIASTAECNRTPFDIAEGESELTGGFHTEYSAMKFAMFFLAEFINIFIVSAISATVFFGGWMPFHIEGLDTLNRVFDLLPPIVWFFGKVACLVFVVMWFRWTFPRLRVDQLMHFEWKYLMPLSLINLALAAIAVSAGLYFFN